jgi:hypothetical protein
MKYEWLNNHTIVTNPEETEKPCYECGYCPYGQLVEEFPLREERDKFSCKVFGHDCPVFYHYEPITEGE